MIIIHGNQSSGKSTLALNLIKNKSNSLYITLINDISIIKRLINYNIDFTLLKYRNLIDIKYRILERGGLINNNLEYVVIDSINMIKDDISYKEKISYIEQLELDFNIIIILVFNTLKKLEKLDNIINKIKKHKVIDVMNQNHNLTKS